MEHPHNAHMTWGRHLFVCRHLEADPRLPVYWQGEPYLTGGFVATCGDCSTVAEEIGLHGVCEFCWFDAERAAARERWLAQGHAERGE